MKSPGKDDPRLSNLLGCPFCGALWQGDLEIRLLPHGGGTESWVICHCCGLEARMGWFGPGIEEEVVTGQTMELWNARRRPGEYCSITANIIKKLRVESTEEDKQRFGRPKDGKRNKKV